jgi:hypothetical protein
VEARRRASELARVGDRDGVAHMHQIGNIPAGAWTVTGVSNGRRQLAFSTNNDGTGPYSTGLNVFNFPQSSSEALQQIDVHFAS